MTAIQAQEIGSLISVAPQEKTSKAIISGTGITVNRVIRWYKLGRSPEEIVETFGHLNLAQVYAALAYYYANQIEIDTQIQEEEKEEERIEQNWLKAKHP
ncbi:MAG: DUF433 domain-containing protein [Anaerolineae bacterium]|nr:DUF433 domain-containing protein [Anaerolineae bacterium]